MKADNPQLQQAECARELVARDVCEEQGRWTWNSSPGLPSRGYYHVPVTQIQIQIQIQILSKDTNADMGTAGQSDFLPSKDSWCDLSDMAEIGILR